MEVIETITLSEVEESRSATIYYGANTSWWTHDPNHLSLTPPATEEEIRRVAETLRLQAAGPTGGCRPIEDFIDRARHAKSHRLPCDPRGGMLYETDNVAGFLAAAVEMSEHYGRHGLRAFMAAHHLNSVLSLDDPRPWCDRGWDAYNDALDRLDARKQLKEKQS